MSKIVIRRALISVSDKTGLIPFAKALAKLKIEIFSTGGTLKALNEAGVKALPVETLTGFPEILDGRVKTLHPKIHGGLLYRRDKKTHENQAREHGISAIDLLVVNLYPFESVTRDPKVEFETAIENIDIGGPSMLRSAAKNFEAVTVVCDPCDYSEVLEEMKHNGAAVSLEIRKKLALKVFERTSSYDRAIFQYLANRDKAKETGALPQTLELNYEKAIALRYGENPHQKAALYKPAAGLPELHFQKLHGKELSYNNFLDIEGTVEVLREFNQPAACVVKHTNPCGVAEGKTTAEALEYAIECDSMSAFGGILGVNQPCNKETAQAALDRLKFFEVFVAPSFLPAAFEILTKRPNLRLIATGPVDQGGAYDVRFMKSGILLQDRDRPIREHLEELKNNLKIVTKAKPTASEIEDLLFAWKCVKVVKSNAIVITQGRQTVGIGAGQMSRVDSVQIACQKAGYRTDGAFLASDAFFPMPDSIETASEYKIRAIIQPGGSVRDQDVIDACDRFGIAMVLTGERHFKH